MAWRWLSKMFNCKFYNNSNSQDYIDEISNNFSDIVKLLKANDHALVSRTVENVYRILERDDSREKAVNTPQMVASLVDVLISSRDQETVIFTLKILLSLSQCKKGLLSIYQSNGIPVLIHLLGAPVESSVYLAVVVLRNLLQNQEGSKTAVCKAGGLQKMMILLKHKDEQYLSVVIDCLRILATRNKENKLLIFSTDGPAELVRIISTYSSITLLYSSTRLLRVLSVCSSNKRAIIAAGGMQALVKHLNNTRKIVLNCLWTLRNLSDALNKQENVESFLKILIQFLGNSDKHIVACTAGILSNMTCNNVYNKEIVCHEMGISALLNVISEAENSEEIIEPVICTLRRLTCEHPDAISAQNAVRLHSGLEPIIKLLQPPSSWSLIKAVIGLVRNLTLCPNNHEPLLALGTVHNLKNMLNVFHQHITENRGNLSCYQAQPTIIGGVKMEDIVEGVLHALLNLARNANVRALLKDDEIINTFVRILREENENVKCIVLSLFCEIASDPSGLLIVETSGMFLFLLTSLKSENQVLAFQSRYLLVQLFTWKPEKYKYLSNEIMPKNTSALQEMFKSSQSVISESGYRES